MTSAFVLEVNANCKKKIIRVWFSVAAERSLHDSRESSPKCPETFTTREESWDLASDQGNSPFGSPWEGVISTSLQRQRNDSTQAVPSSTTNNEG
jgi:hypothetical protein